MVPEFHPGKNFIPDLTKSEAVLGWIYLLVHVLVLPVLLNFMPWFWPWALPSATMLNVGYYAVGLLFAAVFFRKLLRREFDRLCDNFLGCVSGFAMAFFLWYILMMLVQLLFMALGTDIPTNPNDATIDTLTQTERGPTMVMAVFMAPVLEELMFRGVVFQSIRKKHRILAYVVSITLFALYHIWQYAVVEMDATILLYALQYIPITLAITWAYERSGSLWTAIFFHMLNNFLPFLLPAA